MRAGSFENPVRPDGGKKRKKGMKSKRSVVYVPVTTVEGYYRARFLRRR